MRLFAAIVFSTLCFNGRWNTHVVEAPKYIHTYIHTSFMELSQKSLESTESILPAFSLDRYGSAGVTWQCGYDAY